MGGGWRREDVSTPPPGRPRDPDQLPPIACAVLEGQRGGVARLDRGPRPGRGWPSAPKLHMQHAARTIDRELPISVARIDGVCQHIDVLDSHAIDLKDDVAFPEET